MAEAQAKAANELRIRVTRGDRIFEIAPEQFDTFAFEHGDALAVLPAGIAAALPKTWDDTHVQIAPGRAIRVPATYEFYAFKGFRIPVHLISLTGAGPETLDSIGRAHIEHYRRFVGLPPGLTIIDVGCGIGRDAFQLFEVVGADGRYIGIDVTRDSIAWCRRNITPRYPNFVFHHFDARNELYNPFGAKSSMECAFPAADASVDRIVLASVFTHMLEEEVLAYMREFRRILKPDGRVYANFFLYSAEALAAAKTKGNTAWVATFAQHYGGGVYGNDPDYPRGAVAYSDQAMRRLIGQSGLRLMRPYLKGWWSGLHDEPEDGQDAAILGI